MRIRQIVQPEEVEAEVGAALSAPVAGSVFIVAGAGGDIHIISTGADGERQVLRLETAASEQTRKGSLGAAAFSGGADDSVALGVGPPLPPTPPRPIFPPEVSRVLAALVASRPHGRTPPPPPILAGTSSDPRVVIGVGGPLPPPPPPPWMPPELYQALLSLGALLG